MSGKNPSSAPAARRARAVESFKSAAETIGKIEHGSTVFAITRGQFSMIDAILHTLDELGPSEISVWTWTVADYEIEALTSLRRDGRITRGTLVIDPGARTKNSALIAEWKAAFGADSVRYVLNHAKIATVANGNKKVLLRGSMNLNCNPRFEQFDLSEGGADYELVREIERELPILGDDCTGREAYVASRVGEAFAPEQLAMFGGLKRWAK